MRQFKLSSSDIRKDTLLPVDVVLHKYKALCGVDCKAGELACKLAREAFFGLDVMVKCTASGFRDKPGLPEKELQELKEVVFSQYPKYWANPVEFEAIWVTCLNSLSQSCNKLRQSKRGLASNYM